MHWAGMNHQHARDVDLAVAQTVDKRHAVWLPPHEVLRQLLPKPTVKTAPAPKPQAKDRISVGPRSDRRARELVLPRDVDLTKAPKGQPSGRASLPAPSAAAQPGGAPKPQPAAPPDTTVANETSASRLYWPQRSASPTVPLPRSIGDAARHWGERLRDSDLAGLPTGTGQQVGPLFFDPAGADFTVWVNHFKDEVYRNWIVPQSVIMGQHGRVDLQMVVNRAGKIADLQMQHSSGTAALDRAAQNALLSSQLLPLPSDYGPPDVTMRISFLYNTRPGS
jgi:TonB family protein